MSRRHWTFTIEGMTCDHCATTIDAALRKLPGVLEASTDYASGRSTLIADAGVDGETLASAIRTKRFRVVSQDSRPVADTQHAAPDGELDLLIVGGGSAGFAAAIRAADLGAKVAIVEAGAVGGTCVNVGCVPSKTMLRAAEVAHRAARHAFDGIRTRAEATRLDAVVAQKDALVADLQQRKYWDVLAAYPDIRLMRGRAMLRPDGTALVDGKELHARKILLSLGASPWSPPIPGLDRVPFLTSTDALALRELPARLAVIGGGMVGIELAQLFARLGSSVTLIARHGLLPAEDVDASAELARHLSDEGLDILTGATVGRVSGAPGAIELEVEAYGARRTIHADQLLVTTGRRPNTRGIGLEEAGIRLGARGEIVVDRHLETTRPGVYAAGDVIGDPAFVYVAAYAGNLAAENALNGNARTCDLSVVPRVTFTDPAVASVGFTEAQARERGIDVAVSMLPMAYVPRAIAARDTRGVIKLVADKRSNLLVGAHIVAHEAGDMIQEPALAIRHGIRVDELAAMLHPYLTNAEGIKLACQTFSKDVAKLSCCAA